MRIVKSGPLTMLLISVMLIGLAVLAATTGIKDVHGWSAAAAVRQQQRVMHWPFIGVIAPSTREFVRASGVPVSLTGYYLGLNKPVNSRFVLSAINRSHGARPFIEILPRNVPLTDIITGKYDGRLRGLRQQIVAANQKVAISFAPEANGKWYSYGRKPLRFKAAYKHVWRVMHQQKLITWVWQVSAIGPSAENPRAYFPGSTFVNWTGMDGYFFSPHQAGFIRRFKPTLGVIHSLAPHMPVFIAETGVSPRVGAMRYWIRNVLQGAAKLHMMGVVWFDIRQGWSFYHPDWRLEDRPRMLQVFHRQAWGYLRS